MLTYQDVKQSYIRDKLAFYTDPSSAYIEPFRIIGPVYYVGDKAVCVHLIDTGEGLVLLDAGFPHTIHLLTDSIFRMGFDPRDIKYIIHTHGHYDHFGASMEYKHLYGCKLVMSRIDAERLPVAASDSWGRTVSPLLRLPEIDRTLEDGEHFKLGKLDMLCKLAPGHTAGTLAFFFTVEDGGKTYRVGTFGGAGLGSVRRCVLEHRGQELSLQQSMLDSCDMLMKEHVDVMLGNHPVNNDTVGLREKQLKEGGNPFINDALWPAFLQKTRNSFEKMFAQERAERGEA